MYIHVCDLSELVEMCHSMRPTTRGRTQLSAKRWTCDQKFTDLIPCRNGEGFSSPELTLCAYSYFCVCSAPMLPY